MTAASGDAGLRLLDHHVHGVVTAELDQEGIEELLSESLLPAPAGTSVFDSQLGFVVRRFCAPVLDLDPLVPASDYIRRRLQLGSAEASRRLLTAAGVGTWLVDTGYQSDAVSTVGELAELSGTPALEVARIESIAERLAGSSGGAGRFADELTAAVHQSAATAVGFKSVVCYRGGLDFEPTRPGPAEVQT